MTITWNVIKAEITTEKKIVSIQEVIDDVDGKIYTVTVHKTDSDNSIRQKLKTEILVDRALIVVNEAFKIAVETAVMNFEDYLNG